jgi:hypothetical protein
MAASMLHLESDLRDGETLREWRRRVHPVPACRWRRLRRAIRALREVTRLRSI